MAKATSLENDLYPFNDNIGTHVSNVLNDDYPVKNFETYKFKATTQNGSAVAYKTNFNVSK